MIHPIAIYWKYIVVIRAFCSVQLQIYTLKLLTPRVTRLFCDLRCQLFFSAEVSSFVGLGCSSGALGWVGNMRSLLQKMRGGRFI